MRSLFFIGILKYNNLIKQFKFKDKIMGSPYLLSPPLESLSPCPDSHHAPPLNPPPQKVLSQSKMGIRAGGFNRTASS